MNKTKLIIYIFFLLSLSVITADIILDPPDTPRDFTSEGVYYGTENVLFATNDTMKFSEISISDNYVKFNTTAFYIDSTNSINISLVHINESIINADVNDKVLEFWANTSSGNVWFNISGFNVGSVYRVNKTGSTIATPTANASGYITFNNSVWSEQLFEIYLNTESTTSLTIENKTVNEDDTFILHIYCNPNQPVKAWEFSIIFNNTLLRANNVSEGDFLSPYTTFFSNGNISNTSGNITGMYSLINPTAQGNATTNGSCVNISFTALSPGVASVQFLYAGVVDPGVINDKTAYVPLNTFNGTITITSSNLSFNNEFPVNISTEVSRPPTNLSVYINGSCNVTLFVLNMSTNPDTWLEVENWTGVNDLRVESINLGSNFTESEFKWGNTTYTWSVNATNGTYWLNETYTFTTISTASGANSRLDTNNDATVDVFDLNTVWTHRTGNGYVHNDIYNVNSDASIDVFDLNIVWTGRS